MVMNSKTMENFGNKHVFFALHSLSLDPINVLGLPPYSNVVIPTGATYNKDIPISTLPGSSLRLLKFSSHIVTIVRTVQVLIGRRA